MLTLYYTDHHHIPLPEGHKFPLPKYRRLREILEAAHTERARFHFVPAPAAAIEDIELAHDPAYVHDFLHGALSPQAQRRIGFPWSEGLVARTLSSVGGTLAATDDALTHGFGGTLAGGTHHAFYAEGSGFCVFNDIAIAIRRLQKRGRIRRAAVIDLDVHQGDGTAEIFSRNQHVADKDVLTTSIHSRSNFPFRKQQSVIDIELPDGAKDAAYLAALDSLLPRVFAFAPEIIFFQSGVDTLSNDALGHLALTPAGLRERDRRVMTAAKSHQISIVATLGGGYSRPIELTAQAHAQTFILAAELFG